MLGSLSKREREALNEPDKKRLRSSDIVMETQVDDLDAGPIQWETDLDMEKEKARLFGVLGKIVPQTEIFFQDHKSSKQHVARQRAEPEIGKTVQQIKRFDPRNPQSYALVKPKQEKQLTKQEKLKEMGRLEVVSKRQEALVPTVEKESEQEVANEEKVLKIESKSWRDIISERKQGKTKTGLEPEPEPVSFFLDFGESTAKPEQKPQQPIEVFAKPKTENKEKAEKKKKEKVTEKLPFEDLPKKIQRRIEKRKRKKEEQRLERKMRVDYTKDTEEVLARMKQIYPDHSEEKLLENIKYQKMILEATTKRLKKH